MQQGNASEFATYSKLISLDVPRTFQALDTVDFKYNNSTNFYTSLEGISNETFPRELCELLEA